ncbi:MAG TPA: hypothetical protein VFV68_10875 [Agriterribacter sp.]|nr:hypothetical protein [Agriterribacter sp.]
MLFIFTVGYTQEKQMAPAEECAAKLTDWMKTNLQLTAPQEPQVQQINLEYAKKTDAVKNSQARKMEKAKTLKANDQAKDAELKAVLTEDQFKTYQTQKDELKKRFKEEMKEKKQQQQYSLVIIKMENTSILHFI